MIDRGQEAGGSGKRDRKRGTGSGTGPILLSQASFLLAHIANSGPVPLPAPPPVPLPAPPQEGLLGLAGGLGKQAAVTSAKKSSESLAEFEEPGVCTLAVVAGPRR
jgi:hypothetical protein